MKNSMKLALSLLCAVVVTSNVNAGAWFTSSPLSWLLGAEQQPQPTPNVWGKQVISPIELGRVVPFEAAKAAERLGMIGDITPSAQLLAEMNPSRFARVKNSFVNGALNVGSAAVSAVKAIPSVVASVPSKVSGFFKDQTYISEAAGEVLTLPNTSGFAQVKAAVRGALAKAANYTVVPAYAYVKANPKKSGAVAATVGLGYAAYKYGLFGKAKSAAQTVAGKATSAAKSGAQTVATKVANSASTVASVVTKPVKLVTDKVTGKAAAERTKRKTDQSARVAAQLAAIQAKKAQIANDAAIAQAMQGSVAQPATQNDAAIAAAMQPNAFGSYMQVALAARR